MPLYRTSPEGNILDMNPAFVECLGYPDFESLKTMNVSNIYVDGNDRKRFKSLLGRNGMVKDFQTDLYRYDGSVLCANINSRIVRNGDGSIRYYEGSMKDITKRKRAEDEMKRRLMKFKLEEGNLYLVKELTPTLAVEAFRDLLTVGFHGSIISRTRENDWKKSVKEDFDHFWLAENGRKKAIRPKLKEIENLLTSMHGRNVILLERFDYLISKNDFKSSLGFIQSLRELISLNNLVIILSLDPLTLRKHELRQIEKECREVEPKHESILSDDLLTCLRFVYKQNSIGIRPSYSSIAKEVRISRPTVRKRLTLLSSAGYVIDNVRGNSKVVELTEKGRELFLK